MLHCSCQVWLPHKIENEVEECSFLILTNIKQYTLRSTICESLIIVLLLVYEELRIHDFPLYVYIVKSLSRSIIQLKLTGFFYLLLTQLHIKVGS